jgi:hypothetical protein
MADDHLLPAALLEIGDTLNFLEVRKHSLRVKIKDSKLSAATGKVSGLSAVASGGLLYFTLASPLGALLACGGLAAYGLAVSAQWLQTGKLHPFPLTSKTADESDEELSASTLTGGSLQIARSHIPEEASYLEPREKAEYELLHHAPQGLLNAVGSVAPAQRWACYCFLLDAHMTGNLDDYRDRATLETVLGNSSVYHSHLPEAAERFPEIGLDSATAQPPSLPGETDATLPAATSSSIGPTTKFGAIEVPSSPAGETPPLFNPAIDLGQNPQSALIVGTPGSGKGMLVSNAVRVLREKAPALKVMMIDPKGDPKERGYWAPVADVYRSMNLMDCDDPDQGASWLLACMDEFRKLAAPKLLIFDEMLAASVEISLAHKDFKAPQRLKKFVSGIIAQGDSQNVWVWAMSQSVQVADLGFGGGVRGNLRAIAIISPKNTTAIEALTSTRLVPPPNGGMDELRAIMKASPVDRAFYDGKLSRWLPMPKLENHSGFDRDNRTIEATPTVSTPNTPKAPESNVDQLNRLFNSEAVTPSHEDEEIALEKIANPISVSSELIEYVQSRTDVTAWNASSLKRANKKFRKYDEALLNKAFQILAISERGQWDGESFRTA